MEKQIQSNHVQEQQHQPNHVQEQQQHQPNNAQDDILHLKSIGDLKLIIKYFLLETGYQLKCLYEW